jgi:hypothetical protein
MKKIEKGMMVRHSHLGIWKILDIHYCDTECEKVLDIILTQNENIVFLEELSENEKAIQTATHNLIELIQVGDYVNGGRVMDIAEDETFIETLKYEYCRMNLQTFTIDEIETVMTKEQYEANCFHVKGQCR